MCFGWENCIKYNFQLMWLKVERKCAHCPRNLIQLLPAQKTEEIEKLMQM